MTGPAPPLRRKRAAEAAGRALAAGPAGADRPEPGSAHRRGALRRRGRGPRPRPRRGAGTLGPMGDTRRAAPPGGLCAVTGCDRGRHVRTLCRTHYEHLRRGVPLGEMAPVRPLGGRLCEAEGCGRPHRAKGLCNGHYLRSRATVGPSDLSPLKGGGPRRAGCEVEGCARPHQAKGLCAAHYEQRRQTGREPHQMAPVAAAVGPLAGEVCEVGGCGRGHQARGLCRSHYQQERAGKPRADMRPLGPGAAVRHRGVREAPLGQRAVRHPLPPGARREAAGGHAPPRPAPAPRPPLGLRRRAGRRARCDRFCPATGPQAGTPPGTRPGRRCAPRPVRRRPPCRSRARKVGSLQKAHARVGARERHSLHRLVHRIVSMCAEEGISVLSCTVSAPHFGRAGLHILASGVECDSVARPYSNRGEVFGAS